MSMVVEIVWPAVIASVPRGRLPRSLPPTLNAFELSAHEGISTASLAVIVTVTGMEPPAT